MSYRLQIKCALIGLGNWENNHDLSLPLFFPFLSLVLRLMQWLCLRLPLLCLGFLFLIAPNSLQRFLDPLNIVIEQLHGKHTSHDRVHHIALFAIFSDKMRNDEH